MSRHIQHGARIAPFAAALAMALSSPAFAGLPTYTVEDLGAPSGQTSAALAVNRFGQPVGTITNGTTVTAAAFKGGAFPLPGLPTSGPSSANGINRGGVVVGVACLPVNEACQQHAYRWQQSAYIDLGTLGGATSEANGVNDGGDIVGGADDASGVHHAFYYHLGIFNDLGTLYGTNTHANAVSTSGLAVGGGNTADNAYMHAWIFQAHKLKDIGLLDGLTVGNSEALAVNNKGITTGWSYANNQGTRTHIFRWSPGGTMDDLGALPGGANGARGNGVNYLGTIVGASDYDASGATHAVAIKASSKTPVDLNTVLDPITGAGWVVESASAINDSGQIVGVGTHNGVRHAFRLTPM
jgi:probable HAF family extracellular repeat protein